MAVEQNSKARSVEENQVELKASLDEELDRLTKDVLPTAPYLLRTSYQNDNPQPQESSQQYWAKGTLFAPEEEALQYLTFHQAPAGILRSVGQWDDGKGGFAPLEHAHSLSSSGRTPQQNQQNQAAKKKLTMEEYRKNKNNPAPKGSDIVDKRQDAGELKSNIGIGELKQMNGGIKSQDASKLEVLEKIDGASKPDQDISDKTGVKRKRSVSPKPIHDIPQHGDASKPPPSKRNHAEEASLQKKNLHNNSKDMRHLESEMRRHKANDIAQTSGHQSKPKPTQDIPKAISRAPAKPPASTGKPSTLPKLVSPTLPEALNFTLPPLLSPTLPAEIEEMLAELQSHRPKGAQKPGVGPRSARSGSSPQPTEKQSRSRIDSKRVEPSAKQAVPPKNSSGKPSKWVILRLSRAKLARIAKSGSKTLAGSLDITGRRTEAGPRPPSRSSALDKVRSVENLRKPSQGLNGSRTPSTPAAIGSSPPNPGTPFARDNRHSAGPTSTSMLRGGSGQGMNATPLAPTRNATPSSPLKPDNRAEYSTESERLKELGRELKHASDIYLKPEHTSSAEKQQGLVLATESCLTFMLSVIVLDEPSRREGQAIGRTDIWQSVVPFLGQIKAIAEPFPHLLGLLCQLEGVIRDTITYQNSFRIQRFIRDLTAPTESQQKLLRESTDNVNKARRAWKDGNARLWVHDLIESFPSSWAKARTSPSKGKGGDSVTLGSFSASGFALPMTTSTTGIEAVNAGMSILTEYCEREKIEWKAKLII